MQAILTWLAENAIVVACFAPIVWLACQFLRRRPAEQHLLWSLLLVKLLLPPLAPGFWSIGELAAWWQPAVEQLSRNATELDNTSPEPFEVVAVVEVDSQVFETPVTVASRNATSDVQPFAVPPLVDLPATAQTATPIIFVVWIAGCGLAVIIAARSLLAVRRLVHRSHPASPELETALSTAARSLRMQPVPARLTEGLPSPLIVCLARPLLLWPAAQAGAAALGRSAAVLMHELAHVKRRDHWVARLELLAGLIWWWNPVFWLIRRQLRESRELACDALALPADAAARRDYAHLLLEMTTGQSISPLPAPVFGAGPVSRAALHRRLSMMFNERVTARVSALGLAVAAIFGLMLLPGWTLAVDPPTETEPSADAPATPDATPAEPAAETQPVPADAAGAGQIIELTVQTSPAPADPSTTLPAGDAGTGDREAATPNAVPPGFNPATPQSNSVLVVEQNAFPGRAAMAFVDAPEQELKLSDGVSILRVVSFADGVVHLHLLREGNLVQEFKIRIPQADAAATPGLPGYHGLTARIVEAAPGQRYGVVEGRQIITVQPRVIATPPLAVAPAPAEATSEPIRVRVLSVPGAEGFDHLAIVTDPSTAAAADPQLRFECELAEVNLEEKRVELEIAAEEAREKCGDAPDAATRGRIKLLQLAVRKAEIELARCKARLNQPAATPGYPVVPATPTAPAAVPGVPVPSTGGAK